VHRQGAAIRGRVAAGVLALSAAPTKSATRVQGRTVVVSVVPRPTSLDNLG
jgi:hypothetical protein